MSHNLYDKLLEAKFFPVSMDTVFGNTSKERVLSLYNDYAFYVSTWSFFKTTSDQVAGNAKELEAPKEFCIKNFVSRHLSSINSYEEDSNSFDIPVLCNQSVVSLPEQIGDSFGSDNIVRMTNGRVDGNFPVTPVDYPEDVAEEDTTDEDLDTTEEEEE